LIKVVFSLPINKVYKKNILTN